MTKDRFTFKKEYLAAADRIGDEGEAARFLSGIVRYAIEGVEPVFADPVACTAWDFIRRELDLSSRRSESGKKGGAPLGNSNARKKQPKKQPPRSINILKDINDSPQNKQNSTKKQAQKDKEREKEKQRNVSPQTPHIKKQKEKDKEKEKIISTPVCASSRAHTCEASVQDRAHTLQEEDFFNFTFSPDGSPGVTGRAEEDCGPTSASSATPPTLNEIAEQVRRKNYSTIDPEYFWAYYESVGWRDSQNRQIVNWRILLYRWEMKRIEEIKQQKIRKNENSKSRYYSDEADPGFNLGGQSEK